MRIDMNSKTETITFISDQPGTSSAFDPLIENLKNDYQVLDLRYNNFWGSSKDSQNFSEINEIIPLLKTSQLLISGTSRNGQFYHQLWRTSRNLDIPSIAYVEQWTNLKERFLEEGHSICLPDTIATLDSWTANDLSSITTSVINVGHPRLEKLFRENKSKKKQNRLIFVSEPYSQLSKDMSAPRDHFSEFTLLESTLMNFDKFKTEKLVIKLHPREEIQKYSSLLHRYNHIPLEIIAGMSENLVIDGGIFVGISSIMLVEAAACGNKSCAIINDPIYEKNSFIHFLKEFPRFYSINELINWISTNDVCAPVEASIDSIANWKKLISGTISAPRDDTARASCGNGAKRKILSLRGGPN
jgi:hypothetical protein